MASINTNYGAMVAAQSFAATSRELDKVQNRVTTGLKISSAKDNGAVWAIANTQKANAKALDATVNNLLRQQSIADVGIAAGETAGFTPITHDYYDSIIEVRKQQTN